MSQRAARKLQGLLGVSRKNVKGSDRHASTVTTYYLHQPSASAAAELAHDVYNANAAGSAIALV